MVKSPKDHRIHPYMKNNFKGTKDIRDIFNRINNQPEGKKLLTKNEFKQIINYELDKI